ncbi:MAG: SdpI family protein [Sphingobacteriales bacterium]|nr:SdpI family protein [Sphingobacteriales bacterium]OJY81173.1 MAG: hypothetical protein BGP14_08170 [Sphingobacteriales bacterium 44-15]
MKKLVNFLVWTILLAPPVFLWMIWQKLPDSVPMHYNIHGEADRYGSKSELLTVIGVMLIVNIGVYLLLSNLHRIDPRKKYTNENMPVMKRLAFIVVFFLSVLSCYMIYTALHTGSNFSGKFMVVITGLLFAALGNYMYNIKPNYFAGLRLPWTLENEDNWKYTHRIAGRMWFAGGLILTTLAFFLPAKAGFIALIIITAIIVIVPSVYSYRFYKQHQKG